MTLETYLSRGRERVDAALDRVLPAESGPAETVARAMRYAVFAGGKRLRPVLVLAAAECCAGSSEGMEEPATALELIHTYSLIHDDLPAMDDDDLRRGRPTVHRAFDEATAVLAGDALHTLAFEVLSRPGRTDSDSLRRQRAAATLSRGAGVNGMVGGQVADLEAEGRQADAQTLDWIHLHKTGALFAASTEIGGILAGADEKRCRALAVYGESLGLAFQIADDILDCTSDASTLGKTPGKDEKAGKSTYPALFGLEASRARAQEWVGSALAALSDAALVSPELEQLARFAVSRTS